MTGKFRQNHIAAAKLDSMKVLRIRQLYHDEGWSQGRLSRESEKLFGVSISVGQIGRIVRNEAWKQYSQIGRTESEVLHHMALNTTRDWDGEVQASLERLATLQGGIPCVHGVIGKCIECNPGFTLSVALKPVIRDESTGEGLNRLMKEVDKLSPQLDNELEEFLK